MLRRLPIVFAIIALAEYYAFIVVRSATKSMPGAWRISLLSLYLVLTVMSWLSIVLFRQLNWASMPHLLRNVYVAFVLGFFIGKVLVLLVMLTDDIRRLVMWIAHFFISDKHVAVNTAVTNGMSRSKFFVTLALILGGTSIAGFVYGVSNRYKYRVRRIKLKFDSLPSSFRGLKIIQISDLHTGSFDNHTAVKHGIQRVIDEKADIVFFTGDLVNNHSEEVDARYKEIYSRIKAPLGVYSTLGNHDYGDYVQWPSAEAKRQNLLTLMKTHGEMGWQLMMNEHTILQRGEDKIAIIGIENWSAKANFPKYGDMRKAYNGLSEQNIPFKILLSHDPSHWDAQVRPEYPDVQLTLSGHTHGMQFGVESKWLKWSPVQYMYKEWAGLYKEGQQYLYVNRGFGFLGYPGRLGVLPEITVFELV
ncbi:MAG TPA: metallophosphoesterase [Flavipsychrobacter sp.]|nr:metallophosphoesterase [Flavipsychrobacter sp.]